MSIAMICESSRLLLRTWTLEDAADAMAIWGDPDVMKYVDPEGVCRSLDDARSLLRKAMAYQDLHGFCRWAVVEKATGVIVGSCGLYQLPSGRIDVGYYIKRSCWFRGFGTKATDACISYGFEALKLKQIWASILLGNVASQRVLQKLGFEDLGLLPAEDDLEVLDHWFVKNNPKCDGLAALYGSVDSLTASITQ